jgi:microcystin degradation protein MlrC
MPFTVLTAEFSHETNTFSVRPTGYAAFADRCLLEGEAAIHARGDANTGLAGFLDVLRPLGATVLHSISASAEPAGRVTDEAFDRLAGRIVAMAAAHRGSIDGVALALHGAMVTESHTDGEGELLARLRAVLGDAVPIAITLDLHANVTERMCQLAQIIVSYKTYPHVDVRLTGQHAARVLLRAMAGEIAPRTLRVWVPMLEEPNGCRTDTGAMVDWVKRAREYETEPGVFVVSINAGFAMADIPEIGPTILVTAEGDAAAHRRFARAIAADMWAHRHEVLNRYLSVPEAMAAARTHAAAKGPLIIADYSDNPGGGGYGDATALLRGMIEAGLADACFGPIVDPEAAALLHARRPGETVSLALGGKTDARFGGPPIEVTGTLVGLFDGWLTGDGPMRGGQRLSFGPTAVLRVGGVTVLVVSIGTQMLDLQQFRAFGIEPARHRVVGLKSQQHFRAAFAPIAGDIVVCDSDGLTTAELTRFPYRHVPRPIFPLDAEVGYDAASA